MIRKGYICIFIMFLAVGSLADSPLRIYIDDAKVEKDTYYPGCMVKICKEKAKKLKKNYYKSKLWSSLKKKYKNIVLQKKQEKNTDLVITLEARNTHPGKDFISFTVINVSVGAAPIKMKYKFRVEVSKMANGKVIRSEALEFYKKRKISILSDTQKYKKKAAYKTAKFVYEFLKK